MKKTLADFNFFYSAFSLATNYVTRCHYRNIVERGSENIPWGEHFIIAPCHQNALMDPMLILQSFKSYKNPVVFLARADIFRKPAIRAILTWLRISPVYRIRDGRDQLGRNEEIFNTAREVVEKGVPLCLMAEGRHNDKHQLLPLVKGMFRIAGATQVELGDKPLYILPCGIDYDEYEKPMSSAVINYGKPIDIRAFAEMYQQNPPVALNQMRDALTPALKGLMHHVDSTEHYDEEFAYCHLMTQATLEKLDLDNDTWGRFQARRHISLQMAQLTEEEREKCYAQGAAFADECRRKGVPLWFASKNLSSVQVGWTFVILVAFVALLSVSHLWGKWLISNLMVYLPTHLIPQNKIKDPQFRSSVNYGIRLVSQFLYTLVVAIIFWITQGFFAGLMISIFGILSARFMPLLFARLRDVYYYFRMII